MNEIKRALAAADESFLINMANKGIYKRAYKDIEGMTPIFSKTSDSISVEISGETVTLTSPLENSRCSCVSRTVCRHIIGAILIVKNALADELTAEVQTVSEEKEHKENEKAPEAPKKKNTSASKTLTVSETKKINECALDCLILLGDILRNGIVRLPESVSDNAEVSTVCCHALKMADGERTMRSISSLLNNYNEGRAAFSMSDFIRCFCNCIKVMETLSEEDINADMLGSFRQEYTPVNGSLKLMPIGQRRTVGGDYEGEIYYFLNLENSEKPFMSFSDISPVFYENVRNNRRGTFPWGMTTPLSKMMKKIFVLVNAKVNNGKISSSQETKVALTMNANLNCNEMRQIIYTDFKRAAVDLYEKEPHTELERMLLIQPKKCMPPSFDKVSQTYSMVLEDKNGFRAYLQIKYRKENKEFVELLERLGEKMAHNTDKTYTLLTIGKIDTNKLTLYPIDIYDFIDAVYADGYELSDEYLVSAEELSYFSAIAEFMEEAEEELELVVQCGLQTGISGVRQLENKAFNYGLKGFSRLCADFISLAEAYRHNPNADIRTVLHKLSEINEYIKAGKKQLSIILTLHWRNEKQ